MKREHLPRHAQRLVALSVRATALFALAQLSACDECTSSRDCMPGEVCRAGLCEGAAGTGQTPTCDETNSAALLPEQHWVLLDRWDPSAGETVLSIPFSNEGDTEVEILDVAVEQFDTGCATFALEEDLSGTVVAPSSALTVRVRTIPQPTAAPGCACHAAATISLSLSDRAACALPPVLVAVSGTCDERLNCSIPQGTFDGAVVDATFASTVTCANLDRAPVTISSVATAGDSETFSVVEDSLTLPTTLTFGETLEFDELTVYGYEVDRITYDDVSWWTDAGCNTLVVMWICEGII